MPMDKTSTPNSQLRHLLSLARRDVRVQQPSASVLAAIRQAARG